MPEKNINPDFVPPQTKHRLRFDENGIFRILMMSDVQESANFDKRSIQSVNALLDIAKPSLVILGGDNCFGPEIKSKQDLKAFLEILTAPLEQRKIPWAHVFGNHDHDAPVPDAEQQELYEAYPMCVSGHTDSSVYGTTNFVLPIYNHSCTHVIYNVWGLDTNNTADELNGLADGTDFIKVAEYPKNPLSIGRWDTIHFSQLMWYWNTSVAMEQYYGQKIPGLLCMHIAPHEYHIAFENPDICVKKGTAVERLSGGVLNSGVFSTVLQRGDIRTISCGHTHMNDFEAEYCGIKMCWDACAGYRCYGKDELRGGRLFTISEDNPFSIKTDMIYTKEYVTD